MNHIGVSMPRSEDDAIVRGAAIYTGDTQCEGLLEVAFVRSWAAHGNISEIDVAPARELEGVSGVWTAADARFPVTPPTPPNPAPEGAGWPCLAADRVRFVGEAVALIVAQDRYLAEDAAGLVGLDIDPLPAVMDPTESATEGATPLFDGLSNVVLDGVLGDADVDADLARAEVVVEGEFHHPRLSHMALEGRAFMAIPRSSGLEIVCSHQAPHRLKAGMAEALRLSPDRVRVRVPAVGGAFGGKSQTYPEYVAIAFLALELGRPLRWVEDRTESFVSSSHGRGQNQRLIVGADHQGRISVLKVEIDGDIGAYPHTGSFIPPITASVMCGPYKIPRVSVRFRSILTNAVPTTPYRGAGRPEATLALEVMVDRLSEKLGLSPAEVRKRNMIPADEFPFLTPTGERYDSGNYERVLMKALEQTGHPDDRDQSRSRDGLGVASFVEKAGGQSDSSEFGSVMVLPSGRVRATSGSVSTGQGHVTTFTQIVASVLDVDTDLIDVVQGDTELVPMGVGTFASRSVQLGGAALFICANRVVDDARARASEMLEVAEEDLRYASGSFSVAGTPSKQVSLFELAAEESLQADDSFSAKLTYPFGCYVAEVALDDDTGEPAVKRLVAVDDCGNMVNPLLVEGQTYGSIAQGLGGTLFEQFCYDDGGQPLAGSMMDYLAPTMSEIPELELLTTVTPSPVNPLGAKGAGEAGCIGTPAAVSNAILDALRKRGISVGRVELPFTPERIWNLLRKGGTLDGDR